MNHNTGSRNPMTAMAPKIIVASTYQDTERGREANYPGAISSCGAWDDRVRSRSGWRACLDTIRAGLFRDDARLCAQWPAIRLVRIKCGSRTEEGSPSVRRPIM